MNGSTSGTGALRVLCLEDSPVDAELVREALAGAVLQLEWDMASDRPGFEELLAGDPYDVILADYSLPGFDAHGALQLARVACPTTPFICVSGTIGEEATVELLKEGADDCVLKDRLARLPFAVQRAIDERARETELRQSEKKYATAFHASLDSITITRLSDGEILEANEGFERLLGYTRAESVGKTTADLSAYADPGARDLLVTGLRETGELSDFDATLRRKDGTLAEVILSARVIEFQGEECFLAVIHDITDRKLAEETLKRSEQDLNLAVGRVGTWNWDLVTGALEWSPRAKAMFGLPEDAQVTHESFLAMLLPEDREGADAAIKTALAGKTDCDMEYRVVFPDGTACWIYDLGRVYEDASGTPARMAGSMLDITERKRAEELAARQAERIERTLTSVVDITSNIVELRDPYTAGHQRRVSELAVRIAEKLGASGHEVDDIRVAGLLHDMGKAEIPTEILSKPGALSSIEFMLIKDHAEAGYRLAVSANMAEPIAEMIHQHHERCDGSGYPQGLVADQILLGAKVLAVADVVEAMMSHRPYRSALGIKAAFAEIERGSGTLYDAWVAEACIRLFGEGGFEFSKQ